VWVQQLNEYAKKVAAELRRRFPYEPSNVVKSFECLFPHAILASGSAPMRFGLSDFDSLCNIFCPLLPQADRCIEDYNRFKSYILDHGLALSSAEYVRLSLGDHYLRNSCHVTHKLLCIAATLPMTSVECERYFSVLKRVKSDMRNRLSVEATSAVMIVATDAPCVEDYSPVECVSEWFARKKRKHTAELSMIDALEPGSSMNSP